MNIDRIVRSVSVCVLLASGVLPAAAQINLAQRRPVLPAANKLPQTKINPSLVKVNKLAPVAFKPLEMVDPQTGKPIAPTALIHIPPDSKHPDARYPNGRDIPAAQYYDQMNKLETEMNKQGYSFRDAQKQHLANETVVDKAALGRQAANVHTIARDAKTVADMEKIAAAHLSYINQVTAPARLAPGIRMPALRGVAPVMNPGGALAFKTALPATVAMPKIEWTFLADAVAQKPPASSMRPDIKVARYDKGPDNQPMLGEPGSSLLTASQYMAVTFLGLMPPTKKFAWQIVQPTAKGDNFGPNGWQGWKAPWGLLPKGSGTASILQGTGEPYLLIDFATATQVQPGDQKKFLMRIVPVNDDGSAAAYPSNAVTVIYGKNPDPPPLVFPPLPPPPPPMVPTSVDKPWNYSVGDPGLASIDLSEDIQQTRTTSTSSTTVGFKAGASLLGAHVNFIEVTGNANTTEQQRSGYASSGDGSAQAKLSVLLLGVEQCSDCSTDASGGWPGRNETLDRDFGPDIDVPIPFAFSLGPIDVSAQAGFRGSIGVGVHFAVSAGAEPVDFQVGPYVRVGGYLEAAVGIGIGGIDIVQAGVDAQFTVLDFGVAVGLEGSHYYGKISQFVVLQGSLTAFTKAGICPFCQEWDWTIFDYAGVDVLGGDPNKGILFEGTL